MNSLKVIYVIIGNKETYLNQLAISIVSLRYHNMGGGKTIGAD